MNPEQATQLRAPFPDEVVGKLPRITCKQCREASSKNCPDHKKIDCTECRNWITERHIHLDYVGHAAATDRLLQVDPEWTWEPCGFDAEGIPVVRNGQLWIRLTAAGVTRYGVGTADGKTGADAVKEMIGDALRNAAMRFGVALDLWSKEDLHAAAPEPMADPDQIAFLVDAINALADPKPCKRAFFDRFGKPEDLRASEVRNAVDLVESFREQTPPTSAPSPTEPQSVGQSLLEGDSKPVAPASPAPPSGSSVAVESSPPDAPVNEGTAAAPAVPSPKERAEKLAEKAKRPAPADHTVSAHEAKS